MSLLEKIWVCSGISIIFILLIGTVLVLMSSGFREIGIVGYFLETGLFIAMFLFYITGVIAIFKVKRGAK